MDLFFLLIAHVQIMFKGNLIGRVLEISSSKTELENIIFKLVMWKQKMKQGVRLELSFE